MSNMFPEAWGGYSGDFRVPGGGCCSGRSLGEEFPGEEFPGEEFPGEEFQRKNLPG